MARDTFPDGDYIQKLAARKEKDFGSQKKQDKEMLNYYLQAHLREQRQIPTESGLKTKAIGLGLAGFVVDQDVSVLNSLPRARVNPRGGQEAESMASDVLEPFLNTAILKMQEEEEVQGSLLRDLRIFGRIFSLCSPVPRRWGKPMQGLIDDKQGATEESEIKRLNQEIRDFKIEHFPDVWKHLSAQSTWPEFDEDGLAEVVSIRKMTAAAARQAFGDEKMGERSSEDSDIEIVDYFNHKFNATIIKGETAQLLREPWEHHLGRINVAFAETERLPDNTDGLRWKGALFHLRDLIQAMDETAGDIRNVIRQTVMAVPVIKQDPNIRIAAARAGVPEVINIVEGKALNLWTTEFIDRFDPARVAVDLYQFIALARSFADQVGVSRPALVGSVLSGQSAVSLNTASQLSKAELNEPLAALHRHARQVFQLILLSPQALGDEIILRADVRKDGKVISKEIAIGPDAAKWVNLVQAQISMNLPVDEGGNTTNYTQAVSSGALDPWSARERYYNTENPQEIDRRILQQKLFVEAGAVALELLKARLAGDLQQVGRMGMEELAGRTAELPEAAQDVLLGSFEGGLPPQFQSLARAAGNRRRTGRQQGLSQLSGMNIRTPGVTG